MQDKIHDILDNLKKAYDPELFRKQGHELVEMIAEFLSASQKNEDGKTLHYQAPHDQYKYWDQDFKDGVNNDPLSMFKNVMNKSINIHNKKYMGHQIAVTPPVTALSTMVISILNNGMGVYEMGMVGNSLEKVVMEHMSIKIGFETQSSGFVVTGGTIGNLTALLAARASISNIWNNGNENHKFAILVSSESHYCIDRSARIMGLGGDAIIKIPVNTNFQIETASLENIYQQTVADGRIIIACVGCACTTATGSYDDLEALGTFCKNKNIWFHVDGAHGGAAIYSARYKYLLKGIETADSVIIDFHKMMMTPSLSTAIIFKKASNSFKTFSQQAEYLWKEEEGHDWYNSGMRTMECTKSMSVLNIYTLFKTYGEKIFEENIDMLYGLANSFADLVQQSAGFELPMRPQSNIVCFRFTINGVNTDALNSFIRKEIVEEGEFFIVQATLHGNVYLRLSLMNPLTGISALNQLLERIKYFSSKFVA